MAGPVATAGATSAATAVSRRRLAVWWGCAALFGLLAAYAIWRVQVDEPATPRQVRRFVIPLKLPPPTADVGRPFGTAVALSPDGSSLVYVTRDENSTRLDLRSLDELAARPLAGTLVSILFVWMSCI